MDKSALGRAGSTPASHGPRALGDAARRPGSSAPEPIEGYEKPPGFSKRGTAALLVAGTCLVVGVFMLPRLWLQEGSVVTIHDNLDNEILNRLLVGREGRAFSSGMTLPEVAGGLPREFMVTGWSLSTALFAWLPPFWAYVTLQVLGQGVAFVAMYLLLRRLGVVAVHAFACALAFGLLPFYPIHGLSVSGQPMVALAFLNLASRRHLGWSYALLAAFPLLSTFAVAGLFIVAAAGLCYAGLVWHRRSPHWPFLAGILLLFTGYLLTEWQLFSLMVLGDGTHVSHRTVWHSLPDDRGDSTAETIASAVRLLMHGHYHAPSLHTPTVLVAASWLPYLALRARFTRDALTPVVRIAIGVFAALVTIAVVTAAYDWAGLFPIKEAVAFLRSFNLRFYWLQSCGWFVLLGLLVTSIGAHGRWGGAVAKAVAAVQLAWVLIGPAQRALPFQGATELQDNYAVLAGLVDHKRRPVSYREFMSRELFREIAGAIGRPLSSYRVGSIGIHPAVAVYNGFRAVDGYHNNYPLAYKRRFRKVIARELDRDVGLRRYFDAWGSRVYLFSAEMGREQAGRRSAGINLRIKRLRIDLQAFRALGGEYLFSAARIEDPVFVRATRLLGRFSHPQSAWTVYVYAVPPSAS